MTRPIPKKQRALRLLKLLQDGPSFFSHLAMSNEDAQEQYRLWANSWIIGEVKALVPQLREKKPDDAKALKSTTLD